MSERLFDGWVYSALHIAQSKH